MSDFLNRQRIRDAPRIARLQSIFRSDILDRYFGVVTLFGHEDFYVVGLAFILFTSSPALAVRLMVLLTLGIALANALKNHFAVERPPRDIVWTKGTRPELDFGFPSTHAMNAISLPLYSLLFINSSPTITVESFSAVSSSQWIIFLAWAFQLSFSRVYLGVHSPADVYAGCAFGAFIAIVFAFGFEPVFFGIAARLLPQTLGIFGVFVVAVLAALVVIIVVAIHKDHPPRKTFGESSCMLGVTFGTLVAVAAFYWHSGTLGVHNLSRIDPNDIWQTGSIPLLRFIVWAPVLFIILATGKYVFTVPAVFVLRCIDIPFVPYGELEKMDPKRAAKMKLPTPFRIDVPVRVLTYALMSFTAIFILPITCPQVLI